MDGWRPQAVACDKSIMRGFLSVALVLATGTLGACGGSNPKQLEFGPIPPRESTGTFVGATCQGVECSCKSDGADIGTPEGDGKKRFEIRLGSPYELWASAPGVTMYKDKERAEKCFYVDLPPGEHTVRMQAANDTGVAATVTVSELGTKTRAWYDTFRFTCGNPGACSFQELDARKAELAAATDRNVYDKCGSVKVKNVVWDTGKSPDQQYPSQLVVQFTLHVYKFAPEYPPGDPSCGKIRRGQGGDEAPAAEGAGSATPTAP